MKKLITGNNLNGRVKRIAFLAAVLAMCIVVADVGSGESANYGSFEEWGEKYLKAGTIRINDPRLLTFGSVDGDKAILHFNLVDIGKFAGHLCAGSTSGFMITKLALKNLYADGEIPERGDIVLTTSAKGEPMEIAAFITGVSDEDHFGLVSWVVDPSLSKNRGLFVFVFERLSTGRKVKITWNKSKTLKDHVGDLKKFKKKKMRTVHGLASNADAKEWGQTVNSIVMKIINGSVNYKVEVLNQGIDKPSKDYLKGCRCHNIAR